MIRSDPTWNPHTEGDGTVSFKQVYDFTVHVLQGPLTQKPSIVDNIAKDVVPADLP